MSISLKMESEIVTAIAGQSKHTQSLCLLFADLLLCYCFELCDCRVFTVNGKLQYFFFTKHFSF